MYTFKAVSCSIANVWAYIFFLLAGDWHLQTTAPRQMRIGTVKQHEAWHGVAKPAGADTIGRCTIKVLADPANGGMIQRFQEEWVSRSSANDNLHSNFKSEAFVCYLRLCCKLFRRARLMRS